MTPDRETIAAIATPRGTGGIAVIRVSGPDAVRVASKIFKGTIALEDAEAGRLYLGKAGEKKGTQLSFVDQVMVAVFRAPHSYTCEDVVEISCHGGEYVSKRILELLLSSGCRLAFPGEFTERAFLNGRLDLTQAEAVHDIIHAKTERSLEAALSQFQGIFSKQVIGIREQLLGICSLLELELDFAEEDVEFANRDEIATRLAATTSSIAAFERTYDRGRICRDGVKMVLAGKPNVGKSSILNALLKHERAIVTSVPGTTRDTIEEQLDIQGILFRVVDTAGLRTAGDEVERIGVERSLGEIASADIVLFIIDGSEALSQQDFELLQEVRDIRGVFFESTTLVVVNKCDLSPGLRRHAITDFGAGNQVQNISAKEMTGFDDLEEKLLVMVEPEDVVQANAMVTNLRHRNALTLARKDLESAMASLEEGLSSELLAVDLRSALQHLGEIIGEVGPEDVLDGIFSKFCIGK